MLRSEALAAGTALVLLALAGCRASEEADPLSSLKVETAIVPRVERLVPSSSTREGGTITVSDTSNGRGSYYVELPMTDEWARKWSRDPKTAFIRAYALVPTRRTRVPALFFAPVLGRGEVSVQLSPLPPWCETIELELQTGGERARYLVTGLRVGTPVPRLPSRVRTAAGTVEGYGIFARATERSEGWSYAGMALRLPPAPGFIRRVSELDIGPAYKDGPRRKFRAVGFGGQLELPAQMSASNYGYPRWQADGALELWTVDRTGRVDDRDSPFVIERTPGGQGRKWRLYARRANVAGEEFEAKMGGSWVRVDPSNPAGPDPRGSPYRTLRLVRTVPFAVQADLLNEVTMKIPSTRESREFEGTVTFDYGTELAARRKRGESAALIQGIERE